MDLRMNMAVCYPVTNSFFANVDIKGSYYNRAKTVIDFLSFRNQTNAYFCVTRSLKSQIVFDVWTASITKDKNNNENWNLGEFENNGALFIVGQQTKNGEISDFKRKVKSAIDSVELNVGISKEMKIQEILEKKKEKFKTIFEGKYNLIIVNGNEHESGFHGDFSWNNFICEQRGDLKYIVWVYG
jgi:hypothetical protein